MSRFTHVKYWNAGRRRRMAASGAPVPSGGEGSPCFSWCGLPQACKHREPMIEYNMEQATRKQILKMRMGGFVSGTKEMNRPPVVLSASAKD